MSKIPKGEYVYAMRTEGGLIKIGFSKNPHKRAEDLYFELLGFVRGTRKNESFMHEWLGKYRLHGEFFEPSKEVQKVVELFKKHKKFSQVSLEIIQHAA